MRCSKCGEKKSSLRAWPPQKPRAGIHPCRSRTADPASANLGAGGRTANSGAIVAVGLASERTLAASHHQGNQLVAILLTGRILNKREVFAKVAKSKSCLRLASVTILLLKGPPRCISPTTNAARGGLLNLMHRTTISERQYAVLLAGVWNV